MEHQTTTSEGRSDPPVTIPASLFMAMSRCFFGGGPRDPSAPPTAEGGSVESISGAEAEAMKAAAEEFNRADEAGVVQVGGWGPGSGLGKPRGFAAILAGNGGSDEVGSGSEPLNEAES